MRAVLWSRLKGTSAQRIKKETGATKVLIPVYSPTRVHGDCFVAWGMQPVSSTGELLKPEIEGILPMYRFYSEVNQKNDILPHRILRPRDAQRSVFQIRSLKTHALWVEYGSLTRYIGVPRKTIWYVLLYNK